MKCIYKDEAGNRLLVDGDTYYAKNAKGELVSKHGLFSMMKEKGISTKGIKEDYQGRKRE
jgi:hypothetical protein